MERNSESRNRYGNDRNRRQNDQYNDQNLSSDYRQRRNPEWEEDESQWNVSRKKRGEQGGNFGPYSGNANDRRLESMGSLGNDWANRNESDDYQRDRNFSNDWTNQHERDQYYRGSHFGRADVGSYVNRNSRNDNSRNWWDKTKDEVSGWFGDENAQYRRDRDQQNEHRGKGPKGYIRKDERIQEDVHERLTDDGLVDASEIEVDVKNGEVFLKGTVNNRQEKRRAEDIVENISGVKNVENHIKVQQAGSKSAVAGQYGEKKFEYNKNN